MSDYLRPPRNEDEVPIWRERITREINDMPSDYYMEVAEGNVVGESVLKKFGEGQDIDTADGFVDLWDGSGVNTALKSYTYSTTADIDRLSSDAADTTDIEVQGLDTNYDLTTQTITLTGTTPVALTTSLIRVFRLKNVGTVDNAGHIYCFVNGTTTAGVPDTITDVRACIQIGNNQTLMSIYTIPRGVTGYMTGFFAATSLKLAAICLFRMYMRPFGQVFQLKHSSSLDTSGSSEFDRQPKAPSKIPEKTDIVHRASSSVNNMGVSSGFEIILKDN